MAEVEPMDTSEPPQEADPVEANVTLEILKVVKDAQSQHGLKHGDYQRYRAYCARRIKRLRKSLKFQQTTGGKKATYQFKRVSNQMVCDATNVKKDPLRYLFISLMTAERCWAYAMALKQEANTEHRKKFHLVRKLRKSVVYAKELNALCNQPPTPCDARTKLESQAYLCYLNGIYHFEVEQWRKASILLKKAQAIYGKLCEAIVDEEVLQLYNQRVDELKPALRFCAFNLGEQDGKDILKGGAYAEDDYLAAKLDELIQQTREKQAVTLSEVQWLGKTMAVKHEKVRTFLLSVQDRENLPLQQLEKLLFECRDAVQLLRDSNQDKTALYIYLLYLRHDLTCSRNFELIKGLENKTELIRFYEVIIGSLNEIKALPFQQYFNNDDEIDLLMKKVDAKIFAYKALRCYNIGAVGVLSAKQSIAVQRRAAQYATQGIENKHMDEPLKEQLRQILADNSIRETPKLELDGAVLSSIPETFKPSPCKPLFFDLALNHLEEQLEEKLEEKVESKEEAPAASGGITGFVKGFLGGWKK